MANKKNRKKGSNDKPSVEVLDLEPDQDPKGGASPSNPRPVKWELSELDAVVNKSR